ncbi:PAS domain-containing sensor histidine kinase [Quadrisphaera sp. DSM 44207]|uniref:sensor histidine kinase n=1 Tax=Quadrisphaera sp. DSM 44207 TaxID=1881057 RepID=UPI0008925E6E|nr:PAS domain-containing sensor histidine kinase [Quadrisphaera sp. DSM 44207]SDQ52065.1 PAS domain S-box-containing protein [Quadrisphaera sp. DSM 44207]
MDAALADDLPDGLVVAGPDARVQLVNAGAERMTGCSREELLGRDVREALPLQDTTGRDWWATTDPWSGLAIRTGHRERMLVRPGGRELLVTARYARPGRGAPVSRVVLQLRDTEARRRFENDHAGLISTVAHELRSPLTTVKGFTSTVLKKWDRLSDEQKRYMLSTVEADADRVTRLITELLDISRMDAGRLEVRRQLVDLEALLRLQVERMVAAGEEEGRFLVHVRGPLPEVWADPDRLEQILSNLVGNAVRHGEGAVDLSVRPDPDGDGVVVLVEDEGEGIPEEHLGMVFTKFWRGNRRGGTGLGLYVVRGLVEAHDGRIAVSRSPAGGARFRIALPSGVPDALREG